MPSRDAASPGGGAADNPLLARLRARIERDGPLRIDQFMTACVADAEHGYWHRAASIGADGDFITAPEISQVFGELLGLWCAVTWEGMGRPAPLRLVELGPGRGSLMRDALRAARAVPAFLAALRVDLVEISGPLRAMQQAALLGQSVPVGWHASLAEVPDGPALILANEFLDALPIRQLVRAGGAWRERVVKMGAQGALEIAAGPAVAAAEIPAWALAQPAQEGDILELRPGETTLLAHIARRTGPTVALFIDYGPQEAALGDTLQAVQRHRYVDPLASPGSADLTAHVRFTALAHAAEAAGMAADGPLTQAEFLGRLGIVERTARLMAANPGAAAGIEAAVQRLMSPTGMGQLFKAMAVRSRHLPPAPGFG